MHIDPSVIMTSIAISLISYLALKARKKFNDHDSDHVLLKKANLFQIKSILLFMYNRAREKGINSREKEVFLNLYSVYRELGGNGYIEMIKDEIEDMKLIEERM